MIKFFRKIRQKLLTGNKFSKYLLYAIGEIMLVVVGILIAIQINNWNENRKDRLNEQVIFLNLKQDLETEIINLDNHLKIQDIIIEDCIYILKHFDKNYGFKNNDSLFLKINSLFIRETPLLTKTTFETLKNTGTLNLIKNIDLKKQITLFYDDLLIFSENTTNNNTNLVDLLVNPVLLNYTAFQPHKFSNKLQKHWSTLAIVKYDMRNFDLIKTMAVKQLEVDENALKLINAVNFRMLLATVQKEFVYSFKEKTGILLESVNKEL